MVGNQPDCMRDAHTVLGEPSYRKSYQRIRSLTPRGITKCHATPDTSPVNSATGPQCMCYATRRYGSILIDSLTLQEFKRGVSLRGSGAFEHTTSVMQTFIPNKN